MTFAVAPNDAESLAFGAEVAAPRAFAPYELLRGRHGSAIESIATGGGVVVSIDVGHRARLWPSLDGTREPLVLPLSQPAKAAVQRSGSGVAVAAIDIAGSLEVLAIDERGRLTSRAQVGGELAYDKLVALDDGFAAVRRDHVIEWIDANGARRAELAAQPGERIVRVVHQPGHTLVFVTAADGTHARSLETTEALAWGHDTPVLAIDPATAVLAPDGNALVAMSPKRNQVLVVDVKTGAAHELDNPLSGASPLGLPLGFAGADRVVFAVSDFELSMFEWWDLAGKRVGLLGGEEYELEFVSVLGAKAVDGRVIGFAGSELAIATPGDVQYLGYRQAHAPIKPTPVADTHVTKDLVLVRRNGSSTAVEQDWLEVKTGAKPRVVLYDPARKRDVQSFTVGVDEQRFWYEPASRLLVIDRKNKLAIARFDDGKRTFGAMTTIAAPELRDVTLLDPTSGHLAVTLHAREARTWRTFEEPPTVLALNGRVETIDRAGRIYVREADDLVVRYVGDREDARYQGTWTLRPNRDGTRIAAFAKNRVVLWDGSGTELWSAGFIGITDLTWTPDGELVAVAGDLAQLSLDDGHVVAARCGSSFGLHGTHADLAAGTTLCDR